MTIADRASCAFLLSLLLPLPALAGGTPATGTVADELITITGSESKTEDGDYVTAQDGLETYHSFFLEVPEGTSRLVVELFDMDVLLGIDDGSNTDQVEERDRIRRYELFLADPVGDFDDRVGYSLALYELYDPDGNQVVTKRIYGSHFAPGGADDAWLDFYDSNTDDTSAGDQWLDQFSSVSYSNDDGSESFAGPWIENEDAATNPCGTSAGPGGGLLRITGGQLRITDDCDFSPDLGREPSIERELDLSGYASAVLSFDYTTASQIEKNDSLVLELSGDGGTSWTILDDFSGLEGVIVSGSRSYDISDFIASNTRVRFRVENLYAGGSEALLIDNFEIRATTTTGGAPQAGHWELRVDMSSSVNQNGSLLNGDETNAFGIRAHDGDSTGGGTEIPVYTYFYTGGVNPNDSTRAYTLYPYVTSGCDFDGHDFDWDSDLASNTDPDPDLDPPFGFVEYTSPSTVFSHREDTTLSFNNAWNTENVAGWTDNDTVDDYGVWTLDFRLDDPVDGNYAPQYLTSFDAAVGNPPPPGAFPDPDSFRLYLPTDAGGAPAKPHLSQFSTFVATQPFGAGNPPAPGETARYAVSVVVTNPDGSGGDIDFSASRTVTAHFPGSGGGATLTYRGVSLLDQGSIVSQPADGATTPGDVVWNPGTVAAGSGSDNEVKMTYLVDITVPSPGPAYSVDVTGTPASGDGTRATWLDETGDDQVGSPAVFTFGPLCELKIEDAPATPVVLSALRARGTADGLELEWRTASEVGTVAFDLYRLHDAGDGDSGAVEAVRVHHGPLTALLDAPQGGVYRALDRDADPRVATSYLLVERTSLGRRIAYGPLRVAPDEAEDWGPDWREGDFDRRPRPPIRFLERLERAKLEDDDGAGLAEGTPAARLAVETEASGLHRVDAATLADRFGLTPAEVADALAKHDFTLTRRGEPVGWIAAPGGQGLDFWAPPFDSLYTERDVFWLERGIGLGMAKREGRPAPPDWGTESFRADLHLEEDVQPVVLLPLDPESDHWFWSYVQAGGAQPTTDLELHVPDPVTGPLDAELTVHLQGGSEASHRVDVALNGQPLGQAAVEGLEATSAVLDVDPALLHSGANTVTLAAAGGGLVFVDGFDLAYDRAYRADGGELLALAGPNRFVGVAGFPSADVRVFDLADPLRPTWLADARVFDEGGTWRAVWRASSSTVPYLAVAEAGVRAPAAVRVDAPSDLRAGHHQVDLLVVAPDVLADAAGQLAAYRQARGLDVMVARLQDVYDEFAHGVADPRAIRELVAWSLEHWARAPRYVLLAGHGHWDYRDLLGVGGNLLPPLLASRGDSLYPTDAPFADPDGDGAPEVALGRLPVVSEAELLAYLDKVQVYEAAGASAWDHRVTLLADAADASGDFGADSDALQALVPAGYDVSPIHLDDQPDLDTARQILFQQLQDGAALLHYVGHGGVDQLSATPPGLLTVNDIPNLANAGRLPVVTAVTCNIGLHGLPVADSLGEELVLAPDVGAVAVFSPSGLSDNHQGRGLGDRLFRQLFQQRAERLGDAVRGALEATAGAGADTTLLHAYQVLGDPALELSLHPEPPPTCTTDCGNG